MSMSITNTLSIPKAQCAISHLLKQADEDCSVGPIEIATAALALSSHIPGAQAVLNKQSGVAIQAAHAWLSIPRFTLPENQKLWIQSRLEYFGAVCEVLGREQRAHGEPTFQNDGEIKTLLYNFLANHESTIGCAGIKPLDDTDTQIDLDLIMEQIEYIIDSKLDRESGITPEQKKSLRAVHLLTQALLELLKDDIADQKDVALFPSLLQSKCPDFNSTELNGKELNGILGRVQEVAGIPIRPSMLAAALAQT